MSNLPPPIYLALTTAATEQRKAVQLAAEVPAAQQAITAAETEYQTAKAAAEKQLADLAERVKGARARHDTLGKEIDQTQENVKVGAAMVRLWCEANRRPVPEMPELTMPFIAVQSAPDRPGPFCKNCGKPVAIDREGDWFHIDDGGGYYSCYPDAVVSTDAEPAAPAADPNERVDLSATRPDEPGEAAAS